MGRPHLFSDGDVRLYSGGGFAIRQPDGLSAIISSLLKSLHPRCT